MPDGKLHDHPITDLTIHGRHPFPPDIEAVLLERRRVAPEAFNSEAMSRAAFDREAGENLEAGRRPLRRLLAVHGAGDA